MQKLIKLGSLFIILFLVLQSCKDDPPAGTENDQAEITSFSIQGLSESFSINGTTGNITHSGELAAGTDVTALVAEFSFSENATVRVGSTNQVSGETANDFTNPVTYTVTAEDGQTRQDYTVTVVVSGGGGTTSNSAEITSFSIQGLSETFSIDNASNAITHSGELAFGTAVTALVADFTLSENAMITVGGSEQVSGMTANDFSSPVIYTVTAEDGITSRDYTVTIVASEVDPDAPEWNAVTDDGGYLAFQNQRAALLNNEIYVIGTASVMSGGPNFQQIWKSADGLNWEQVSTTPDPFPTYSDFELLSLNDELHAIAGRNLLDFDAGVFAASAQNTSFSSTDASSWTENEGLGFSARISPRGAVFNGEMYIVGGNTLAFGTPNAHVNDVWRSTNGLDWTLATDAPGWDPRSIPAVFVHDGKLWMTGGGGVTTPGPEPVFNDVWYTEDGNNWTQVSVTNPYPARAGHSAISYEGNMYVLFGEDGLFAPDKSYFNDIWVSEDNGVTWSEVTGDAAMPDNFEARAHSSVLVDGEEQVWIIGGTSSSGGLTDVWRGNF